MSQKKKLAIFDITRDGKGISKKDDLSPSGLKRFFMTFKNNFGKLVSVNMIMVIGNFPLLFLVLTLSGYSKVSSYTPLNDLFQNLNGLFMIETANPAIMSLYALEGLQNEILINTTLTYVFYGLAALTLLTFGIVNAGTAYVLRNMAMGDAVFVWTDFWYAVKRNWKQALPFGVADGLIHCILAFNIYTMMANTANFFASLMFWATVVLCIVYFFMRCYIYVQMVTFDMKVMKILKNSLIFSLLGLKRNVMAFLGAAVFVLFEILFLFNFGGILLPLAVAMPLAIMFAAMAYMKVYASYFKIKEIIIDPYNLEHPELSESEDDYEVIMQDDVTLKERLEQIKNEREIQ